MSGGGALYLFLSSYEPLGRTKTTLLRALLLIIILLALLCLQAGFDKDRRQQTNRQASGQPLNPEKRLTEEDELNNLKSFLDFMGWKGDSKEFFKSKSNIPLPENLTLDHYEEKEGALFLRRLLFDMKEFILLDERKNKEDVFESLVEKVSKLPDPLADVDVVDLFNKNKPIKEAEEELEPLLIKWVDLEKNPHPAVDGKSLFIKPVKGDGNCFFNVFALYLFGKVTEENVLRLKAAAIRELILNFSLYRAQIQMDVFDNLEPGEKGFFPCSEDSESSTTKLDCLVDIITKGKLFAENEWYSWSFIHIMNKILKRPVVLISYQRPLEYKKGETYSGLLLNFSEKADKKAQPFILLNYPEAGHWDAVIATDREKT